MKISGLVSGIPNCTFTSDKLVAVDLSFLHQDNHVEFSDVYLSTYLRSRYGENAQVQSHFWNARENSHLLFTIFGPNILKSAWIGDYAGKNDMKYTEWV